MRILILGGSGFIGQHVVSALAGHDITLFGRGVPQSASGSIIRHIRGDRANIDRHRTDFAACRPDVVLDMNARNGADAAAALDAIDGSAPRIVLVSSHSVYRTYGVMLGLDDAPIDNDPQAEDAPRRRRLFIYRGPTPRLPDDPKQWMDDYDKIPAEDAVLSCGLSSNIVRLPLVYGPGDPDGRVSAIVDRLALGQELNFTEPVARWRHSRAHVVNAAAAIALVVLQGRPGDIYNVAEPDDWTETEWVDRIAVAMGRPRVLRPLLAGGDRPLIADFPSTANFGQHFRADSRRIRAELGYTEQIPPQRALRDTVEAVLMSRANP